MLKATYVTSSHHDPSSGMEMVHTKRDQWGWRRFLKVPDGNALCDERTGGERSKSRGVVPGIVANDHAAGSDLRMLGADVLC